MPEIAQDRFGEGNVHMPLIVGRYMPGEDVIADVTPGLIMPHDWLDRTPGELASQNVPAWFTNQHKQITLPDGTLASQWVAERETGIPSHPVASPAETCDVMATAAVRDLLNKLLAQQIDINPKKTALVLASTSMISLEHGMAPLYHDQRALDEMGNAVAKKFGFADMQTINNACSGGVAAFMLAAKKLHENDNIQNVVVAASERFFSDLTNPHDLGTRPLFGDGAGAMLMTRENPQRLPGWLLRPLGWRSVHDDSQAAQELLCISHDDIRTDPTGVDMAGFAGKFTMDGPEVFKAAFTQMPQVVVDLAEHLRVDKTEIQLLLAHQPNARILKMMAAIFKKLGMKCAIPIHMERGNLSSVSIFHLIERMLASGELDLSSPADKKRFLVAMTAIGIGVWTRSMLFEAVRGSRELQVV